MWVSSRASPVSFQERERRRRDQQTPVLPQPYEQVKGDSDDAHLHQRAVRTGPFKPGIRQVALLLTPLSLLNKGIEHAQVGMVVPGKMPTIWEQLAFQSGHQDED